MAHGCLFSCTAVYLAYLPTPSVPAKTQSMTCRGLHQALEDAQGPHTKGGTSRVAPASSQRSSATRLESAALEASPAPTSEHQRENAPSPSPQQVSPGAWCMRWGWRGEGGGLGSMGKLCLQLLLSDRSRCAVLLLVRVLLVRMRPIRANTPKRWLCTSWQSVPCLFAGAGAAGAGAGCGCGGRATLQPGGSAAAWPPLRPGSHAQPWQLQGHQCPVRPAGGRCRHPQVWRFQHCCNMGRASALCLAVTNTVSQGMGWCLNSCTMGRHQHGLAGWLPLLGCPRQSVLAAEVWPGCRLCTALAPC